MTAASIGRDGSRYGEHPIVSSLRLPVGADVTVYQGTALMVPLAGTNAGYAIPGAVSTTPVKVVGVALGDVDNASGSAGALFVEAAVGVFDFINSSSNDAITDSLVGQPCYLADDQTVARTPGTAGTRPFLGRIVGLSGSKVMVEVGSPQPDPLGNVDLALTAGADLSSSQFLCVKLSAANTVTVVDGAGGDAVGVLQNAPANGAVAIVRVAGITQVIASTSVSAAARVASTNAGKTKAAVVGTVSGSNTTGSYTLGTALTAGTADAVHRVLLQPMGLIPHTAA